MIQNILTIISLIGIGCIIVGAFIIALFNFWGAND
jgi:hypothetical protein